MNDRIYNYIETVFKNAPNTEETRARKESMYQIMSERFDSAVASGMTADAAFAAAVNAVNAPAQTQPSPVISQNAAYADKITRVRPYSSSWIKAAAVAVLILSPLLSILRIPIIGDSVFLFVVGLAVGLLVFDAFRLKYPDISPSAPLLLGLAVFLYISAAGFTDISSKYIPILSIAFFAVPIALGVIADVFACKQIRLYKEQGGVVVKKTKGNSLGWLIMLLACLASAIILITVSTAKGIKAINFYINENGINFENFADGDTVFSGENGKESQKGPAQVNTPESIRIAWSKGNVTVKGWNENSVYFTQSDGTREIPEGDKIRHYTSDGRLTVFQPDVTESSDCVVYIPYSFNGKLELEAADSDIEIIEVSVKELKINGAAENLSFTGNAEEVELNDTAGNTYFDFETCPHDFEYNTLSGKTEIRLPADSVIKIEEESLGGKLSSEFTSDPNSENEFEFSTMGGRVIIVKK